MNDLINISNSHVSSENNDRIERNTLLYPISKAFLEQYPQYSDMIDTFDQSVESMCKLINSDSVIDTVITCKNGYNINFKLNMKNVRMYTPDSIEAAKFSNYGYTPTPNFALATKKTYSAVMVADINFSISHINVINGQTSNEYTGIVKDGYCVNIPIPMGCKYCSLRKYDPRTLVKSAEDRKELYGYFIIDGFIRYILPIYKKPFNKPIILKNDYDEQLSRTEVLYTSGYEYENSYYTIGAMVIQKTASTGRSGRQGSLPDFGFSLMFNHPAMNTETVIAGKHSKKLINFIPIRFMFYAFGCNNDEDILKYICPGLNDFSLMNAICNACTRGYKHMEAIKLAELKIVKNDDDYIILEEPLTENIAKYIIGCIILNANTKKEILEKSKNSIILYKTYIIELVNDILNNRMMPGVKRDENRNNAICLELGYIVSKLYYIGLGLESSQDKTSLTNRRIRIGQQLSREFKTFHNVRLRDIITDIKPVIEQHSSYNDLTQTISNRLLSLAKTISGNQSRSLINAFKGTSKEQSKLRTEILVPKNQIFVWNKLREIVISSELKVVGATVSWEHRTVHQSELFFICPTETPEAGSQTGRFKTPTIHTRVTLSSHNDNTTEMFKPDEESIKKLIKTSPEFVTNVVSYDTYYNIRINGSIVGFIPELDPVEKLYRKLMDARYLDDNIPIDCTIVLNNNNGSLDIWTDTGRLTSLFVVVNKTFDIKIGKKNKQENVKLTDINIVVKKEFKEWIDMCNKTPSLLPSSGTSSDTLSNTSSNTPLNIGLKKNFIEYLCPDMAITNCVIAPSLSEFYENPILYTHIALPGSVHGIIAANIPCINMNAGVKAAYATNHVKQAIGVVNKYPQLDYPAEKNILLKPQAPLVSTCTYNYLNLSDYAYGTNVIIMFAQWRDNQEDCTIFNREFIEHGGLKIDSLHVEDYNIENNTEVFKLPNQNNKLIGNPDSYYKIDPQTALPSKVSEKFYTNDVLIAKINNTNGIEHDTSILNKIPDGKYPVTFENRPARCIIKSSIQDNNLLMKRVTFGNYRAPIVGDKANSEHCQKGTIGAIIDPDKMPYNSTGIRPDIIFNFPAIYKRKTYGHIYVSMLSLISALYGCPIDCTPYHTVRTTEELYELARKIGLDDNGYDTVYDPITGRPLKCRVFIGCHYWERQSHLVEQKLNIRNGGPIVIETGQPMKGRKHNGGQSSDRMSFDAHNAAGICEIIRDLHLNQGSQTTIGVCNICKSPFGYYNKENKRWVCPACGVHTEFTIKNVPPASVLMFNILNGLHIGIEYDENGNLNNNFQNNNTLPNPDKIDSDNK